MALLKSPPLPEGFRITEADGCLRLFNPHGILLKEVANSPAAAAALEERAWRDIWEHIERDITVELMAFREGSLALHELRRVCQYMRMLDAVRQSPAPAAVRDRSRRSEVAAWLALAASAAALALVILSTPVEVARSPEPSTPLPAFRPEATPRVANRPAAPTAPARLRERVQPRRLTIGRPPVEGYVVTFGAFASRTTAEISVRVIRAKGYIVYVTPAGNALEVATRPYRTREQAERLANALQEIGLPARARVVGTL
jgi:cell division septation protein DedD